MAELVVLLMQDVEVMLAEQQLVEQISHHYLDRFQITISNY